MFEDMGTVISDPYQRWHQQDTDLWLRLLSKAHAVNTELYAILDYLRGAGTVLMPNDKFGYVLAPLIGDNAWQSMEQYKEESQYLNMYKDILIELLGELRV